MDQEYDVRLNENDKDPICNIGPDSLSCVSSAEKLWAGARATHGVKAGKYFYEATISGNGISRLGWSTMAAHRELGKDSHGFGYGGTGMKSLGGAFDSYGGKFGNGDVLGCFLDWEGMEISYSVNGSHKGAAFRIPDSFKGTVLFPAVVSKNAGVSFNFGKSPFRFPPPRALGFSDIFHGRGGDILNASAKEAYSVAGKRIPMAIILEPARDLAEQVHQNIAEMSRYVTAPEIKSVLLVGGDDGRGHSKKAISTGVDIVVGTLGKVCDMVKAKVLDLSQIRFFVLDEADRLTDPENMGQIMQLYSACPGGGTGDNRLQVRIRSTSILMLVMCATSYFVWPSRCLPTVSTTNHDAD